MVAAVGLLCHWLPCAASILYRICTTHLPWLLCLSHELLLQHVPIPCLASWQEWVSIHKWESISCSISSLVWLTIFQYVPLPSFRCNRHCSLDSFFFSLPQLHNLYQQYCNQHSILASFWQQIARPLWPCAINVVLWGFSGFCGWCYYISLHCAFAWIKEGRRELVVTPCPIPVHASEEQLYISSAILSI